MKHSREYLSSIIHYEPTTGEFRWLVDKAFSAKKGALAGAYSGEGYRYIEIDYTSYRASRLAFILMGVDLPEVVDHIDGNKANDKWENLKASSKMHNSWNRAKASNNTSGIKGLSLNESGRKIRYVCSITVKGKRLQKYFPISEKEEAIKWLRETRQQVHKGNFYHG